jgi:hypothetical protein
MVITKGASMKPKKIHWEFGGPEWTKFDEFCCPVTRNFDIHMWLQDREGYIYDIIHSTWKRIGRFNKCPSFDQFESGLVLEKREVSDLQRGFGLVYRRIPDVALEKRLLDAILGKRNHKDGFRKQQVWNRPLLNAEVDHGKATLRVKGTEFTIINDE